MRTLWRRFIRKLSGLRGRLMLLVLLSLGPALGLVAYLGLRQGAILEREAAEHVGRVARLVELEYVSQLERTRHTMAALAVQEELRTAQPRLCARALAGAREMDHALLGLGLVDATGKPICTALATPSLKAEDLALIDLARRSETIAQGEYRYQSELRRSVVALAFLLPPEKGRDDRVLFALVDPLQRIERLAKASALEPGAVIAVLNGAHKVLLRFPDREHFTGQIVPETEVLALKEQASGEALGIDGVRRLWAFAPLRFTGQPGDAYVQVGVPSASVTDPVRRETRTAYALLFLAATILLVLSWAVGGRLLVQPVRRLARLTHAVADGDLAMRTGMQQEAGEIGELARAFDAMAKRLEEHFEALNQSRRAAARSEQMFRAVADQSTCGILLHLGGKMVYVNRRIESLTGFSADELLKMQFWEVVRPDYQATIRDRAARRLAGETIDDVVEFPLNTRDGSERWVGSSGSTIALDGKTGALITWWDITARRDAERAAREGEQTLRSVMNNIFSIVLVHRGDKLIFVNDALVEATGRSREELLTMHHADIYLREDRLIIHERATKRMRGEEVPDHYEARLQHRDGRIRWVEVGGTLIEYQGAPAMLGNCYDITERVQRREMTLQILHGNPAPTFVLDEEHRVRYWNAACENAFGVSAEEMVGTREQWRPFYAEERPVLADVLLSGAIEDQGDAYYSAKKLRRSTFVGEAYEAEDFFPQFGSRGMWLHFTAAPLRDSEGKVIGAIETLLDVTDRRLAEDELRQTKQNLEVLVHKRTAQLAQAKEALEADNNRRQEAEHVLRARNTELTELNRKLSEAQEQLLQSEKLASIGQLAAGVAHEINNPIGYVHSNLGSLENYLKDLFDLTAQVEDVLAELPESDPLRRRITALRDRFDLAFIKEDLPALLEESKEGITRVKKIVQDLKDFSRVDTSQEWQMADLHSGIDSTLNIVRNEIKYKADVVKEYGDLPHVECLLSQLNQVFMNLLVNAAHAMKDKERGTITVRTGQCDEREVWIEVSDDGCGISPANLKRIFDPFFTTKPVGKGTGLGLSLAYGIVQKHHGRIEVKSEEGRGTTFRVVLPVSQANATAPEAETVK